MAFKIDPDTWYTQTELAELFESSPATFATKRVRGGGIPYSKFGKSILYRGSDAIEYLECRRKTTTSDLVYMD